MKTDMITLRQLDQQLKALKESGVAIVPQQGWVRTIRKMLGMTIKQLARRLGVDPSRVVKIEMSEAEGAVTLRTMQSVAEAMGCKFVCYLIPQTSLEDIIKSQAMKLAKEQIKRTSHTMDLEAQSVAKNWLAEQRKDLIYELLSKPWKYLWEE